MTNTNTHSKNTFPKDNCKFCGEFVNLDDEGTQYRDGSCAHESCDDSNQFQKANESDFRD